ncbi:MAG: hypothetical protein A3F10_06680 [Coxiella sp. RIFCSPHIGHO2_12_FULL_42_15]|nr:MAG: hypothetical protein A3F10_06680 [Coxiella sp. RIFCSPHIGHO2_12_FULL_42_15]
MIDDEAERTEAIDPTHSFIIQAPAGSGKTELLAQRYLNLLAHAVKNPEEIIAITFTRKAAAEMRERIITALALASESPEPSESHKKKTWQLAHAVLRTNAKNHWHLLSNPNRLRILTIDALSAMLSTQMPILSGFGAKPKILDDATSYYRNSVVEVLDKPQHLQADIEILLLHFDNNAEQLAALLIQLLSKRDQWLPHIMHQYQHLTAFKAELQHSLQNIITEILQRARSVIPLHTQGELCELIHFAAEQLLRENPTHPITACHDVFQLPETSAEYLPQWQGIASTLLTKEGEWRKAIDKRVGFPADKKSHKRRMLALLTLFREYDEAKSVLFSVLNCPPAVYTEQQWQIIQALMHVLPQLTAELHWQFQQHNVIDFVELTLGALRALGDEQYPTDLALYLDYQIRHLLVDEFQDTSVMQFKLLHRLVQEWQPQEGKTLFLVGDPMQSIYRFRNAEVGLFLQAQHQGMANIPLRNLRLTQNFRSHAPIVAWINESFNAIFPATADTIGGAVPYNASIAVKSAELGNDIRYHASHQSDTRTTPQKIVDLIQQWQREKPNETIAVLVRSRSHLADIIPALNQHHIAFQAVELETLNHRAEIQDLVALTRALLHLADRIAWLAVLRAPWSGIKLHDLHAICQYAGHRPLWFVLQNYASIPALSHDAKIRLQRIVPLLAYSLHAHGRATLSEWIKGTWLGLSGPATLNDSIAQANVAQFFQLLEDIQQDFSFSLLEQKLERLYAKPEYPQHITLQLMTIHKSKGLEFDHVILPELQKMAPAESNPLLLWLEYPNRSGKTDLVLAPIKASHESIDPIHHYLKRLENTKLEYELARLLYVATTRAKKSLHLFCKLTLDEESGEINPPAKNTFLGLLWELYSSHFLRSYSTTFSVEPTSEQKIKKNLQRLPDHWPIPHPDFNIAALQQYSHHPAPFALFEQHELSIMGTLIHEALQKLAKQQQPEMDFWHRRLIQRGVSQQKIPELLQRIHQAMNNTRADPRGQWILKAHRDHQCEYALTMLHNNDVQTYIIDRTFIDENNARWIIDYKSTTPPHDHLADFLKDQKNLHQEQLHRYAECYAAIENRVIYLGLYFPLCSAWVSWEYSV